MPKAKKKSYIFKEVLTEAEKALKREVRGYYPAKYESTFSKMIKEMRLAIQSRCAIRYGKIKKSSERSFLRLSSQKDSLMCPSKNSISG